MKGEPERISDGHPYFIKHGFSKSNLIDLIEKCEKKGCKLTNPLSRSKLGKLIVIRGGWSAEGANIPGREEFYAELECPDGIDIDEIE